MAKSYDYLFKLLLIGDFSVGKSSLMNKFSENDDFDKTLTSTIGIDFIVRTINVDGKKIKLQIWDTAGQERFQTISTSYYRNAMGIMFVYDITNEKSFKNITNWIRNFKDWNTNVEEDKSEEVEKLLIGNQCHRELERQVSSEQGEQLAIEHGIKFIETSAEENIRVDDAFFTLARDIKVRKERILETSNSLKSADQLTASKKHKEPTSWFSGCILF